MCSVQSAVCSVKYVVCSVQCVVCSVQCTVCGDQSSVMLRNNNKYTFECGINNIKKKTF